jgi:hypothetical protein
MQVQQLRIYDMAKKNLYEGKRSHQNTIIINAIGPFEGVRYPRNQIVDNATVSHIAAYFFFMIVLY